MLCLFTKVWELMRRDELLPAIGKGSTNAWNKVDRPTGQWDSLAQCTYEPILYHQNRGYIHNPSNQSNSTKCSWSPDMTGDIHKLTGPGETWHKQSQSNSSFALGILWGSIKGGVVKNYCFTLFFPHVCFFFVIIAMYGCWITNSWHGSSKNGETPSWCFSHFC